MSDMTKEEAIENLKELLKWYLEEEMLSETVYKREAVNMAISALKGFEGMTNGEVIKALFPNAEIEYWAEYSTYNIEFPNDNDVKHFSYSWWNAPYKSESEGV